MRVTLLPILLLPLAACAGSSTEYPSLAIRDVERLRTGETDYTNPAAPLAPLPAQVSGRLENLRADALAADAAFADSLARARPLVATARGAPVTARSWARAQVAVADVSSKRSAMALPLADIEKLYVEYYDTGVDAGPIEQVRDNLAARQDEQDRILAGLRAQLAR